MKDLGRALEAAISAESLELMLWVARTAERLGMPLYIVGGVPRDLLLQRQPTDSDLVVEGDAIELAGALATERGGRVVAHWRFGTASWYPESPDGHPASQSAGLGSASGIEYIDLVTARRESYPRPAALPQVIPASIEHDLRRRDFTINAMAIRLDGTHFGTVLDPVGGAADLDRRLIRVLHDKSFEDDPTRLFRAVRYGARLGFRLAPDTKRLLSDSCPLISRLSAQRLRHELDLTLDEDAAAPAIKRLGTFGVLQHIHPALPDDKVALSRLRQGALSREPSESIRARRASRNMMWMRWLMGLSPLKIRSIVERLHFDKQLAAEVLAAAQVVGSANALARLRPSAATRRLESHPISAVVTVQGALPRGRPKSVLNNYLTRWRHVRPRSTGADLRSMEIPPGPRYRDILLRLRNGWLDGKITSAAQEREHLERVLRRMKARGSKSKPTALVRRTGR